jgi:hypothetical protein
MPTCPSSPLVLEASAVVAFAGTAKLIAANRRGGTCSDSGPAVRRVVSPLMRAVQLRGDQPASSTR